MATKTDSNSAAVEQKNIATEKPISQTQVETKPPQQSNDDPSQASAQEITDQPTNVTGRAVFAVETTAAGVVVRTAFLTEENKLLNLPAVFPDLVYAMNVIDDLKRQVMQHFSQAAQVGAQVIASQALAQQQQQTKTVSGDDQVVGTAETKS